MELSLIKHWVDVSSDQGQHLMANPNANFALYNPDDHPKFAPRDWHGLGETNCLGYAMQAPSETLYPGFVHKGKDEEKYRLADIYNRAFANSPSVRMDDFKAAVYRGMEKDGIEKAEPLDLYKPGHYLIALCFSEIQELNVKDFHYMVLNSNGLWSEINGAGGHVNWSDLHDDPITNPATAILNHTMNFDSFHHVPKGGAAALRAQQIHPAHIPAPADYHSHLSHV